MAREIVDIALVSIDHSGGRYELTTVQEMTVGNPDPKAPVKTMNRRRRAIGYTRGVPDFSVDLTVAVEVGTPEVDWRALNRSGERFELVYEEADGGKRFALKDCVVNEISKPFSEGGEHKLSVKITALDELEL